MSVSNGQTANQTTFNNAFVSKTVNSTTIGQVSLANVDSSSGDSINNIQREFNALNSFLGKIINVAKDSLPAWTSGASGDMYTRLDAISETVFAEPETLIKNVRVEGESDTATLDSSSPIVAKEGGDTSVVSGIVDGTNGKFLIIINTSSADNLLLVHSSSEAADGDKILCPSGTNVNLNPYEGCILCYYNNYWRVVGRASGGSGAGSGYFNLTINEHSVAPTPVYSQGYKEWEFEEQSGQGIVMTFTVPDTLGPVNLEAKFLVSTPAASGDIVFNTSVSCYTQLNSSRGSPLATDNEDTIIGVTGADEYMLATVPITQNLNDSVGEENVYGGVTVVARITRPVSGSDTVADVAHLIEGSIRVTEAPA